MSKKLGKISFGRQFQLKVRQQADKSANHVHKSLLANQKVGKMGRLKCSMMKQVRKTLSQCFRFQHHVHFGTTNINVVVYVADDNHGCPPQVNKQVDVFGSGNNIAETINTNNKPLKPKKDGE